MNTKFYARFSGSPNTPDYFSLYDLYDMCDVYNKELTAFGGTIIPYVSDRYDTAELKAKIAQYSRADLLSELNKMISGLAMARELNARNERGIALLCDYEEFFATVKDNIVALHYDCAFVIILAMDKLNAELKELKRNKNIAYEYRKSIERIEFFMNIIKSHLGDDVAKMTGKIDYADAARMANRMHRGEMRINALAVASHINRMKDIRENARKIKQSESQHTHEKRMTRQITNATNDIADLTAENIQLRAELERTQRELSAANERNAQIATLEQCIAQLRTDNEKLKRRGILSVFGRSH